MAFEFLCCFLCFLCVCGFFNVFFPFPPSLADYIGLLTSRDKTKKGQKKRYFIDTSYHGYHFLLNIKNMYDRNESFMFRQVKRKKNFCLSEQYKRNLASRDL